MSRPSLLQLSPDRLAEQLRAVGASARHVPRIRRALLAGQRLDATPGLSSRIVASLREAADELSCATLRAVAAPDGSTKHLVRLHDGRLIEAVALPGFALAPFEPGAERPIERGAVAPSACISTQVGCAIGCRFCASGLDGVARNLEVHELLEQVALLRRSSAVRRLVLMGSGEPTQNLANVAVALDVLRDEADLGPRSVVVSTVGPTQAIDRLTALGRRFTLAVSLHAARHDVRAGLVPTQRKVDPAALLDAADRFEAATGRAYQVEYVLLSGINDAEGDAADLARLLAGRRAHVSLIRWNAVDGMPFGTPTVERTYRFLRILHEAGVSARLRRTVGLATDGACGQLVGATVPGAACDGR